MMMHPFAFVAPIPIATGTNATPTTLHHRYSTIRHRHVMTATPPIRSANPSISADKFLDVASRTSDTDSEYRYGACAPAYSDYLERVLTSSVYDVVDETALERANLLSDRLQNTILLKREDTTDVKSFKVRGAYNMMAKSSPAQLSNGVVAASAGNHAQGVALAAQHLGVRATIVMPAVTPEIKVEAVRRRGARAILHGDNFDEAKKEALRICDQERGLFIPPFDHPDIIAGQGTVGLELIRQNSGMDAVFVPVGGGGLIAGIATVLKRLRPQVKVIGVEPCDAAAMYGSLKEGKRVKLDSVGTFADGVAVIEVGEETFRLCRELVDEIVLVETDEICAAIKDVFEDTRSILEPAGALSVAGVKKWVKKQGVTGGEYVAITSGANTNFDRLRHVSERAEIGEGREGVLAVTIPEREGSFRELIGMLRGSVVTEFNYRYCGSEEAHVFVGIKIKNKAEVKGIIEGLGKEGIKAMDLTDDEMAKLHVRHLVGGHAIGREFEERVFRFEFPERPGALKRFLDALPRGVSITMFHYRNHGADVGRVLVGLTGDGELDERLQQFLNTVGYQYVQEDNNLAYQLFLGKRS